MDNKSIFVGIRVDNKKPWFNQHLYVVNNLEYPKENLRFVYSLQDNAYTKSIAEDIKKFRDENNLNIEVYKEPFDRDMKQYGVEMGASIFKDWQAMFSEDYFMLLDSDIVQIPQFAIKEMQRVDESIVAPYIYMYGTRYFYDTFKFRINGKMFHHEYVPGSGLLTPIKIDSAGGCMLIKGDVFKNIEVKNPYPTVNLCYDAARRGYRTVGLPYLIVQHANLLQYGITHKPLPQQFGGYPQGNVPITCFDKIQRLNREPMPLTPELKAYLEKAYGEYVGMVNEEAQKIYDSSEILQKEKSLKWVQNIQKFYNFYFTRDPLKIMINYYLEPLPEWFEFESSTTCQFKCKMCEHTYWKEPSRFMSFDTFKGIVDQFQDLKWIGASGIGESFLDKDYRKMLRYVKEKDPSIYVEFFDQFYLQKKSDFQEWIDMSYDKIYLSFDAASKEVYEKQRPGSNYDKVLKNLILFDKMKKDQGKHYPRLCTHYIINKDNIHECEDHLQLLKDHDIDIWFVQFSKVLHSYPEIEGMQVDIPEALIAKIQAKGKELGIETRFNVNTNNMKAASYGCTAYTQPFIFADGSVIPCCACNEQNDREYQKQTALGNLTTQSLKEIWYSERARKYRYNLYTGRTDAVCERCPLFNTWSVS